MSPGLSGWPFVPGLSALIREYFQVVIKTFLRRDLLRLPRPFRGNSKIFQDIPDSQPVASYANLFSLSWSGMRRSFIHSIIGLHLVLK